MKVKGEIKKNTSGATPHVFRRHTSIHHKNLGERLPTPP